MARSNTPQAPTPKNSGRPSGVGATFLILCAIVIAGIVPVLLAGQLLGIWHVDVPYGIHLPF